MARTTNYAGDGPPDDPARPQSAAIGRGEHILLVAGHFAPESTSGTHRSLHFARALRDAGFTVSVITLDTASLNSVDPALNSIFPFEDCVLRIPRGPTLSTMYISAKNLWQRVRRGTHSSAAFASAVTAMERIAPAEKPRNDLRHELSILISYPDLFRGWRGPAVNAARELARTKPISAVFASGPPWTGLLVARDLARQLHCKLIVDFRDPWTRRMGSVPDDELPRYSAWAERDEARIVAIASAVLVNTPQMLTNTRKSGAYPRAKIRCLLNGTDVPARSEPRAIPTNAPLVLRHFGSLYGGRSIVPFVDALTANVNIDAGRLRVELVGADRGESEPGLSKGIAAGLSIECLPSVPYSDAIRLMSEPSILLAVQGADFAAQIPTKIYEYLRTGNPLLVLTPEESAVWKFVSQFPRCHRLDFSDVEGNRALLARMYQEWSTGRLAQVPADKDTASFSKSVIGREFAKLVREVLDDTLASG